MTYASPAAVKPFVQKGQLKMLGVVMSQRYPTLPDLPTIRETAGMESYDVESWFALFAPAGTPDAIVKRLNAEVRQALQTPGIANQLVEMVGTPSFEDADQARVFVRSEIKKYASILNTSNIGRE
jgi:tripartite-type tricarboxylate transporter receptor subunit TctC